MVNEMLMNLWDLSGTVWPDVKHFSKCFIPHVPQHFPNDYTLKYVLTINHITAIK